MSNDKVSVSIGGWPLLITVILCILKIINIINISWWWCFCLIWMPFAILFALIGFFIIIFVIVLLCALIIELIKILKE
jgi:hypothetical protein